MSAKTIESMVNWIEENLMEKPTLEELSNHVGYSSYYCSAKFHEIVGITLKQYVVKRRLSLAAMEVRDTHNRLLEIAVKYGYSSQEAFTRAFNDAFGCTPYQCRKKLVVPILYLKPQLSNKRKDSNQQKDNNL